MRKYTALFSSGSSAGFGLRGKEWFGGLYTVSHIPPNPTYKLYEALLTQKALDLVEFLRVLWRWICIILYNCHLFLFPCICKWPASRFLHFPHVLNWGGGSIWSSGSQPSGSCDPLTQLWWPPTIKTIQLLLHNCYCYELCYKYLIGRVPDMGPAKGLQSSGWEPRRIEVVLLTTCWCRWINQLLAF